MATLQELQAEVKRLREENERKRKMLEARQSSQREIKKIGEERKRLEREIKSLKNPNSQKFKKVVKSGFRKTGSGLWKFLEAAAETQQPKRRQPTKRSSSSRTKRQKDWYENYW